MVTRNSNYFLWKGQLNIVSEQKIYAQMFLTLWEMYSILIIVGLAQYQTICRIFCSKAEPKNKRAFGFGTVFIAETISFQSTVSSFQTVLYERCIIVTSRLLWKLIKLNSLSSMCTASLLRTAVEKALKLYRTFTLL